MGHFTVFVFSSPESDPGPSQLSQLRARRQTQSSPLSRSNHSFPPVSPLDYCAWFSQAGLCDHFFLRTTPLQALKRGSLVVKCFAFAITIQTPPPLLPLPSFPIESRVPVFFFFPEPSTVEVFWTPPPLFPSFLPIEYFMICGL